MHRGAGVSLIVLLTSPNAALAHAGERGFVLLLPTGHYIAAGVCAVIVTFLVLALAPGALIKRLMAIRPLGERRAWRPLGEIAAWLGFLSFAALIAAGFWGPRDPAHNPLPVAVWSLWWVGFTIAVALLGDLWRWFNPWRAPMALIRGLGGARAPLAMPERWGRAPAILSFLAFAWFEIASIAPADPAVLARAAGCYWLLTLVMMLLFGEADWRRRGEGFAVFFSLIARLAPLRAVPREERMAMSAALPGARLARSQATPPTLALFLYLALAAVSFDGLRETFFWLWLIGENPLEFAGRSAVIWPNTLGLLGAWLLLGGAFCGAVWLGLRLIGERGWLALSARLALSLIPIALGYHIAHYLISLLIQGQYALALAAETLGLGHVHVSRAFLNHPDSVAWLWAAQAGAIALGHLLAVLIAHRIALDGRTERAGVISQIPVAALMALYTWFGLWLLSTPTGT